MGVGARSTEQADGVLAVAVAHPAELVQDLPLHFGRTPAVAVVDRAQVLMSSHGGHLSCPSSREGNKSNVATIHPRGTFYAARYGRLPRRAALGHSGSPFPHPVPTV